jgi:2-deoxy-D-gluconate 3-dehydrogenase
VYDNCEGLLKKAIINECFETIQSPRKNCAGNRCDKGIGKSFALALAEAGAHIIGVSRNLDPAGSDIQKKVEELGRKFYSFRADFSDRASVYAFLSKLKADHPVVDILVNNAGTIMRNPAAEHSDENWDQVISVNLNTQFVLAREIGKLMLQRGYGKIIFTCSMLSYQGGINVPGYTASKSAVAGLVKALANEWAGRGVNVNGIAPGYIATDNTEALRKRPGKK